MRSPGWASAHLILDDTEFLLQCGDLRLFRADVGHGPLRILLRIEQLVLELPALLVELSELSSDAGTDMRP